MPTKGRAMSSRVFYWFLAVSILLCLPTRSDAACDLVATTLEALVMGLLQTVFGLLGLGSHCNWPGVVCNDGLFRCVEELHLTASASGAFPTNTNNLAFLRVLNITGQVTGAIPTLSSSIRTLIVKGGQLTSATAVKALTGLEVLDLSHNTITTALEDLLPTSSTSLQVVKLANNTLSGTLGTALNGLTNLVELDLSDNLLEGSVTGVLQTLTNLETLDLSRNLFDEPIQDVLELASNVPSLTKLNLRDNLFGGPLVDLTLNLPILNELDLGENLISGELPLELLQMANLDKLWLDANQLIGRIPLVSGLTKTVLDLSDNLLCGSVPPLLRFLDIVQLNLNGNCFSDPLPNWCNDGACSETSIESQKCTLALSETTCVLLRSLETLLVGLGPTRPILTFPEPPGFGLQPSPDIDEMFQFRHGSFVHVNASWAAIESTRFDVPKADVHDYFIEEEILEEVVKKIVYSTVLPNGALAYFEHYLSNFNFTVPFGDSGESVFVPPHTLKTLVRLYDWPSFAAGEAGIAYESNLGVSTSSNAKLQRYESYELLHLPPDNSTSMLSVQWTDSYRVWADISLYNRALLDDSSIVPISHEFVLDTNLLRVVIPHHFHDVHYDPQYELVMGDYKKAADEEDDQLIAGIENEVLAAVIPTVAVSVLLVGAAGVAVAVVVKTKGIALFGSKASLAAVNFETSDGLRGLGLSSSAVSVPVSSSSSLPASTSQEALV